LPAVPAGGPVRDLLEKASESLERASREVINGWLERRAGEVLEMVTGLVAGEVGLLLELARSPGVAGAEIAGLARTWPRRTA
jgi:hypothetical protein